MIDVFIDESKSKETETQPEPEDGGEESREEGNIACKTIITRSHVYSCNSLNAGSYISFLCLMICKRHPLDGVLVHC